MRVLEIKDLVDLMAAQAAEMARAAGTNHQDFIAACMAMHETRDRIKAELQGTHDTLAEFLRGRGHNVR